MHLDTVLLGYPFTTGTVQETLDRLERMITERSKNLIITANLDFAVKGMTDPVFKQIGYSASLVTPDGMPLVWAGRMLRPPIKERVAGSDSIPLLLERAAQKGYSVFLLGARPGVADMAAKRSRERWPGLKIVGTYSPPFAGVWDMDNEAIVGRVNNAAPDILLVSLGSPKQEYWMSMNLSRLNVPVTIGVGGTIDFLAGIIPRAPEWMKGLGLEWMWRMGLEPRRLTRRYAVDMRDGVLPLFLQASVDNLVRLISRKDESGESGDPAMSLHVLRTAETEIRTLVCQPENIQQTLQAYHHVRHADDSEWDALVLDLQGVTYLDSAAVSAVVALDRMLQKKGKQLVIAARRSGFFAFYVAHVRDLLSVARSRESAFQHLQSMGKKRFKAVSVPTGNGGVVVKLKGDLTARTTHLLGSIRTTLVTHEHVIMDFSEIHAMDTAGLAQLVELWKTHRGAKEQMVCAVGSRRWANVLRAAGPMRVMNLQRTIEEALRSAMEREQPPAKRTTQNNTDNPIALAQ